MSTRKDRRAPSAYWWGEMRKQIVICEQSSFFPGFDSRKGHTLDLADYLDIPKRDLKKTKTILIVDVLKVKGKCYQVFRDLVLKSIHMLWSHILGPLKKLKSAPPPHWGKFFFVSFHSSLFFISINLRTHTHTREKTRSQWVKLTVAKPDGEFNFLGPFGRRRELTTCQLYSSLHLFTGAWFPNQNK